MKPNREIRNRHRENRQLGTFCFLALIIVLPIGEAIAMDLRSQLKLQTRLTELPADSQLRSFLDPPIQDNELSLRVNIGASNKGWSWSVDYQWLLQRGEQVEPRPQTSSIALRSAGLPDDSRRLFDLSHRIDEQQDRVISHRLDRLYLSHRVESWVFTVGRQAVSWGNGQIYNPVDFFNPFDPAAIDTEFKTGDDLLYLQYLQPNGNDLQAVWVLRRDANDKVKAEVASLALKYHGFFGQLEYDLLLAEHFEARILATGGSIDYANAVWRSDVILTDSGNRRFTSAVLNWTYSWIAWHKNLSATVEYFHNGFGLDDGNYDPLTLAANPQLTQRLARGELFTLGENYVALAANIELAPLWVLSATLFNNLDDDSRLLQLFSRHDLEQDLQLLLALNLPSGDDGSEFGGIDSAVEQQTLAIGNSWFAQLAWYF